jgi:hypothetical protein
VGGLRAWTSRDVRSQVHSNERVVVVGWTRADYEVLGRDDRLIGRAAIDELCACTHAARDHDETGCTAISFVAGRFAECRCAGHRPACTEAELFAPVVPT